MLGGRVFKPTEADNVTFDQYAWIQSAADKAGLGEELKSLIEPLIEAAKNGEADSVVNVSAEKMATAIVLRCYDNRAHLDVLAGTLVEVGKLWTHERAEKNREFFGSLKGEDIEKVQLLLSQLVLAFFWSGLDSMMTSPKYSAQPLAVSPVGGMESQVVDESDQESALESSGK